MDTRQLPLYSPFGILPLSTDPTGIRSTTTADLRIIRKSLFWPKPIPILKEVGVPCTNVCLLKCLVT